MRLYLAHPFPERRAVREWELRMEKKLDIEFWNPFYDGWKKEWIDEYNKASFTPEEISKFLIDNAKKIVITDLQSINESDGLVALLPYPSIGVSMEVFYCSFVLHKPALIFQPELIYSAMEKHPWLIYFGKVYKTKSGLISGLKALKRKIDVV